VETLGRLYSNLRRNGRSIHIEEKGEGVSLGTIHTLHRLMKAIFKKAVAIGVVNRNPAKECSIPKNKHKELYIFSNEESKQLLERAKENGIYLPVLIALFTGLSRGELVALRWSDFSFSTGELKVKRTYSCIKGEPAIVPLQRPALYRSIYLPKQLTKIIHSYKKTSTSLWLFPAKKASKDRPQNPNNFTLAFKEIVRDIDCEQATFASLRDTFAVQSLNHGVDIRTLSCVLGNASVRAVMRAYIPLMDKHKRAAAEKIEGAMLTLLNND
jgi:integrase